VRLSASGDVVVLHDPTLARVTQGRETRAVAELSTSELSRAPLGATGERVSLLADVVEWAALRQCALNVEVKHDVPAWAGGGRIALVRAVARELRDARAATLVSSFDPLVLLALRALAPRVPCALLTDPSQAYAGVLHAMARRPFVAALHVERRQALAGSIARWKRRGITVGVWTVNDPNEARRLADLGVDMFITDEPGRILEAVS